MQSETYYEETTSLAGYLVEDIGGPGLLAPPRVRADASCVHWVISTPTIAVREVLAEIFENTTGKWQKDFMEGKSFYTLLLNLVVRIAKPIDTFLDYARFKITLGKMARILKIAPDKVGIEATLEKSGERSITFSPGLKVGPSVKLGETTTETVTTESTDDGLSKEGETQRAREISMGAEAEVKFNYNNKKGWTLKVPKFIREITGAVLEENGVEAAEWMIHGNKAIRIPGEQTGSTVVVKASMIVMLPEKKGTQAEVTVDGRVTRDRKFRLDARGPVKLVNPKKIPIGRRVKRSSRGPKTSC